MLIISATEFLGLTEFNQSFDWLSVEDGTYALIRHPGNEWAISWVVTCRLLRVLEIGYQDMVAPLDEDDEPSIPVRPTPASGAETRDRFNFQA